MKIRGPHPEKRAEGPNDVRVNGVIWTLLGLALLALPWWVFQYGYLPDDDALRHAAKAIAGKPWTDILVLRPDITIDHNPGWHRILAAVCQVLQCEPKALVEISVAALFVLVAAAPLIHRKRPEMWVLSLALISFLFPYFPERIFLGRPLLLTMAVTLFLLSQWSLPKAIWSTKRNLALTLLLMAVSTWVHGSWYLLVLIPVAFLIAGKRAEAGWLALCWGAGALLGALATGHPWTFLSESARIPFFALGQNVPPEVLVREFEPYTGSYPALIVIAGVLLWKKFSGHKLDGWWRDPALCLAILGCLLGFRVVRFWLDWGLPALVLWLAKELEEALQGRLPSDWRRVCFAGAAAILIFAGMGSNRDQRWSRYGKFDCLSAAAPGTAGWMPEPGGVLYAVELSVFYHTFYCNPRGDWRYALGFEATFMRPEDFAVYVTLCRTRNALVACAPWIERMRPADRLVLTSPPNVRPAFPKLEWHYGARNTWIGRLPRPAP